MLVLGDEHDAEDIAQDAYLAAFRSWHRFDGSDVRAWLYTIALRLAFNQLGGRRRFLAAIGRIEPKPWADTIDPDLWAALRTLDPRTRSALLLNVIDGYTQAEIGQILSVAEEPSRAGSRAAARPCAGSSARIGKGARPFCLGARHAAPFCLGAFLGVLSLGVRGPERSGDGFWDGRPHRD